MTSDIDQTSPMYRRRWWTLAVLCLSLAIIGLDNTILNVAIPTIQREFAASGSELQWIVDIYILVFAGLLLTLGTLGDRFGRHRALEAGLTIFGLASLGAAYANTTGQLITGRAIMGIGGALIMPATLSIIIHVFPREERGKAIAIWTGISGAAIGLGPLIGGILLEYFWWGSVFLVNVPIAIIALIAGRWLVPESRDPHPAAIDLPGAALSMTAISVLLYGIIEAPSHGWLDPLVLTTFAAAVILGIAFFLWERWTDHPMLELDLFRNARFSSGAGAIMLAFFALFGTVFLLTQYLQFVHGYTALEAGVRMIPVALGIMAGAGRSHLLVHRFGTTRVVAGGMVGLGLVLGSITLWTTDTRYWIVGVVLFLMAFTMGNIMAPSTDAVMGAVPGDKAGVGSAMNDVTRQIGGALGVAVIGSAMNTVYADRMNDAVAALPPQAAGPASDSIGPAIHIASQIGGPAGEALAAAAGSAFVDGQGIGVLIAAGTALAGAILVARFMPTHDREPAPAPEPVVVIERSPSLAGKTSPNVR
jgi:EmrB/QacA subfamily drug resistance transporter